MKALIKVGYRCNNHCSFCHTLEVRHLDDTAEGVHAKIERAADLGHRTVVLSGGEPTARPELVRWARHAHLRGLGFGLVTNGRMLGYTELVDRLQALGLSYIYMSLHGGNADVHDALVGARAFEQGLAAVRNLSGRSLDLTVNCVVTTQNLHGLRDLVDLLLPFDDVVLKFSMVHPKGGADRRFEALIPRVTDVAEAVADAIRFGQERSSGLGFAHDGIPLCLLPGLEGLYDDLKTHGFAVMTEVFEPDFYPVDDGDNVQTPRCDGCALRGPCVGLYRKYAEAWGDEELRPVPGVRSNSFNYVHERDIPWPDGEPCPISDSVLPYDRGRHVFVDDGVQMGQYRTRTRDFSDVEIRDVKYSLGQIYIDISDKHAPDDFSTDLRKLVPHEACAPCPHRGVCAGCFRAEDEDVFGRDDRRVRDLVSSLSGDILDVGCGESRYADTIGERVEAGAVRYVGIEPDAEAVRRFRTLHPWADVRCARVETLHLAESEFDHVLVLRSYNHLSDPGAVLRRLCASIRPGGSLLVVDNVAFGLVRSRVQADRGEGGPAGFEHFFNHDSHQAARSIPHDMVELIDHLAVDPAGSNQWLLHYRRRDHVR